MIGFNRVLLVGIVLYCFEIYLFWLKFKVIVKMVLINGFFFGFLIYFEEYKKGGVLLFRISGFVICFMEMIFKVDMSLKI